MPHLSVQFTDYTEPFATFVLIASLEHSTGRTVSLALTNGFLIRCVLLVVRETLLAPKISITFGAGISNGGEVKRRPSHTMATHLFADVCVIPCVWFVTRFTNKRLRHRARSIHDQVMVSFDIFLE